MERQAYEKERLKKELDIEQAKREKEERKKREEAEEVKKKIFDLIFEIIAESKKAIVKIIIMR